MNNKIYSPKNKTLNSSMINVSELANKAVKTLSEITNKILLGDAFKIIEQLPDKFIDLLIVDPPYNLSKTYSSKKFNKMSDNKYYL
jgi:site-specific DNA-methyltransferase (adenine-specific)